MQTGHKVLAELNLQRLKTSNLPRDFVIGHNGEWNHQAWLDFCAEIEAQGYTPIDFDQAGLILENLKQKYKNGEKI